jgi:integrase
MVMHSPEPTNTTRIVRDTFIDMALYPLAIIQAILRHANPNTTARYIRSLGLEETRGALEEGLKGPAQVIEFKKVNAV